MEIKVGMLVVDTVYRKLAIVLAYEDEGRWKIRWCGYDAIRNAVSGTTLIPPVEDIPKVDQRLVSVKIAEKYLPDLIISLAILRAVP